MAPTAIYRDDPEFDNKMYAGEATFVGSPWQEMMDDYLAMNAAGYFNEDALGVNYDGALDMMASAEAAMLVQGNWAIAGLRTRAPEIEWGMFPLPYNKDGGDIWVSAAVGALLAVDPNGEHVDMAKKYVDFWASPEIQEIYLTAKKAFPASKGVNNERAIVAHLWGVVEATSMLIGIENCWLSMARQSEAMRSWFDRYADWLCGLIDSIAGSGVDIVTLSDDWGSMGSMLFSPQMWRNMIKPFTARVVQHARNHNLYVNLHSAGYIMPIMDEIIAMGFTSLHPIQESAGMDPATVKRQYGDQIVIYGSLDVVDGILSHESEALERYISERFQIYAPGGGFIFNSAHFIQPDIPPQRLLRAYALIKRLATQY